MGQQVAVRGTLDDLSTLVDEIEQDGRFDVSSPSRVNVGFFEREPDGQLEVLEIVIGLGSNLVAAAAYDSLKSVVRVLKERGSKSLEITKDDDESPGTIEGK